jgi:pimeloyl-ACP methyl ester carboxylesterase
VIGTPTLHVHDDGHQTWLRADKSPAQSPPEIVLLHGWTLSSDELWHSLYPKLVDRTSFVAIDLPGHGRSDPPRKSFSLDDAATRVVDVIRAHCDTPVHLVGFSLGGPVALLVAAQHPELVAGLVLASTSHRFDRSLIMRGALQLGETLVRSRVGDSLRAMDAKRLKKSGALAIPRPTLHPPTVKAAGRCLNGINLAELSNLIVAPAVSVITTADRMIEPARQHDLAELLHARVIEVDGPHTIYERNPTLFADAIAAALEVLLNP